MTFLSITVSDHRAFSVVTLNGELDTLSVGRLRQVIERTLDCGRVHLVVDTAGLRFCDSCGLRTLIAAWRQTNEQGGSLRLVRVHGPLGRLLELTGLSTVFPTAGHADLARAQPARARIDHL
ncbi:STAS domain-containing protein [Planomonospora parontospora]|uniref:STAS domain-containing protein n=1 Tax=Planomonospora parontospora TaxID=58119 RepID=UPI0016702432|nr:STAS domain-containing protein [Planomonospora parontospora]GGL30273.1 hypothetical protein GCM10014719_34570 [Planomonospora parontospora subsp. antibiotica]GII17723.1 hypothetical protein Ppa05_44490 [Planomonospora parontospora subsp. antibiotica]